MIFLFFKTSVARLEPELERFEVGSIFVRFWVISTMHFQGTGSSCAGLLWFQSFLMVLAPEDQGHVLVTINITKAPVFAITINGIIISDNNHHHSHQYKQHLPHCPIHPLIIINASIIVQLSTSPCSSCSSSCSSSFSSSLLSIENYYASYFVVLLFG